MGRICTLTARVKIFRAIKQVSPSKKNESSSATQLHDPEGTRHELFSISFFVNVFLHSRAFNIARCIGVEGDPELVIQCYMQQHSLCTLLFF